MTRYLTPQEFGELAGVTANYVQIEVGRGHLPAIRRASGRNSARLYLDRDHVPAFVAHLTTQHPEWVRRQRRTTQGRTAA